MDTMVVHAHFLDTLDQDSAPMPDQWTHDLTSGALSYRFSGSPNTYSWDADAIASMPVDPATEPTSQAGRELLDRWTAIQATIDQMDHRGPDLVLVDHREHETRLVWADEKVVIVIEHEEPNAPRSASSGGAGPIDSAL